MDGLRGLAALSILFLHYIVTIASSEPGSPLAYLLRLLSPLWIGVDLFFVLSGFLVGKIIFSNQAATNFKAIFYLRRAARILPLYFLLVGVWVFLHLLLDVDGNAALKIMLGNFELLPYLLTFTQNLVLPFQEGAWSALGSGLAPTWSICLEEHFYWLAPLLLPMIPTAHRPAWLLGAVMLFLGIRIATLASGHTDYLLHYLWTPLHVDGILAGLLLASIHQRNNLIGWVRHRLAWPIWCAAFSLLWLWIAFQGQSVAALYLNFAAVALLFFFLVRALLTGGFAPLGRLLCQPLLRWFGERSYGIYLLHNFVLYATFYTVLGTSPALDDSSQWLCMLGALAVTIGLSQASFLWFEKPILLWARSKPFRHREVGTLEPKAAP